MSTLCIPCGKYFKPIVNGGIIDVGFGKVRNGDIYHCPQCDKRIVMNMGESYIPDDITLQRAVFKIDPNNCR